MDVITPPPLNPAPVKRAKTCCCCGSRTEPQAQWWNRDTGFGLCERCIDFCAHRETPEEFQSCYGIAGVHYAHAPTLPIIDGRYRKETPRP